MPFNFRDKPKLSERLRGKSGEELINELKSDIDNNRRMFFESPSFGFRNQPRSSGFSRGFPFDDDSDDSRRVDLRSYFNDISSRHPEFGDFGEEFTGFGKKRRGSGTEQEEGSGGRSSQRQKETPPPPAAATPDSSTPQQGETQQQPQPKSNLPQYGLRNTVPLAHSVQTEEDRRPRSMSAPPDNRNTNQQQQQKQPKRYVTRCEIPINNDPPPPTATAAGKPPMAPKTESQQEHGKNVRVIPIVVEGRTEPLINRNVETNNERMSFDGRLPRDFGNYQKHSPRFGNGQSSGAPSPPPPTQQPAASPTPTQEPTTPPLATPPPTQTPSPNDPMFRVQLVQREVEKLHHEVEQFDGDSKSDKRFIYLDEMLTRNLIKLDDIDAEGKEEIRLARKEAIKSIQRCISILENKVGEQQSMDVDKTKEITTDGMEVEQTNDVIPLPLPSTEENTN